MIRLDTVNRSLQLFLGSATTTNPLQIVVCYSDQTASTYNGATQLSNSNGTTAVTICSAPASGAVRDIDMLSVLNTDTAAAYVTIEMVDTSTPYQIIYVELLVGDKLTFTHGSGWQVVSDSGNIKYTVQSTGGVDSFNTRTGAVTLLSSDVTGALGYTPFNPTTTENVHYVYAGPSSGSAAAPTFRALVAGDIPALSYAPQTSGTSILYGNGSGGFSSVTIGSGISFSGGTLSATGSTGTVTSVGLSLPSIFTVSGSPVTSSGTLTATLASETANYVFAAPNGSAGTPTFRALVSADIPALSYVSSVSGTGVISSSGGLTPIISISQATSTTSGYLSSTDWNTFNNKGSGTVTSVSGTSPVSSTGGTTPTISLASAYGDTQNPYGSKTANYVLAAPNGSAGTPSFRAIVAADIPTLNQNTTGNAATATNLSGGSTYSLVYQTSSGNTSYLSAGTSGSLLMTLGTVTAPTWVAPSSLTVGTATNVAGGAANELVYNTGSGATSFVTAPTTASTYLGWNGTSFVWGTPAGIGTVTSVGLSLPSIFSVSGSPVTSSGTLTATLANETANYVFAGPSSGSATTPTFRALVAADIPALSYAPTTGSTSITTLGTITTGTWNGSVLGAAYGGSGEAGTLTGILYGNGTSAYTVATTAQLLSGIGTLPIANGGTGQTSFGSNLIHYGSFSTNSNFSIDNNLNLMVGTTSTPTIANSIKAGTGIFTTAKSVTATSVNTSYQIYNGYTSGLIVVRDNTNGGSAVFMIDPNRGNVQISSNLINTITFNFGGGTTNFTQTTGSGGTVYQFAYLNAFG
jgi:hypothetical protein